MAQSHSKVDCGVFREATSPTAEGKGSGRAERRAPTSSAVEIESSFTWIGKRDGVRQTRLLFQYHPTTNSTTVAATQSDHNLTRENVLARHKGRLMGSHIWIQLYKVNI